MKKAVPFFHFSHIPFLDPTDISFRLLANERGSPSLAGKSDFGGNARTGPALILLVGILVTRGKFQILAAKETAYVTRAASTAHI